MDDEHHMSEKHIVERLKYGDFEAFDQLFWRYHQRLYYFAESILKNNEDARDVVQEVFYRVWKNRDNLNEESSLKSFLFTISYNLIVDLMRRKMSDRNFRDKLLKNAIRKEAPVEQNIEFKELRTVYNNAVEKLPPQRRKIYKLHRFDELNYEEIAEKLDISVNTVKSQMNKALSYLRKKIGTKTLVSLLFLSLYI